MAWHKRDLLPTGRVVWLLLLLGGAVSGCAGLPSDSDVTRALDVQRLDSPNAQIVSVRVRDQGGGLEVSGRLQKRYAGRSPIPGKLHIEALDRNGVVLGQDTTPYYRLNPKMGSSTFSQFLDVRAEDVRTLRVVHHQGPDESSGIPLASAHGDHLDSPEPA